MRAMGEGEPNVEEVPPSTHPYAEWARQVLDSCGWDCEPDDPCLWQQMRQVALEVGGDPEEVTADLARAVEEAQVEAQTAKLLAQLERSYSSAAIPSGRREPTHRLQRYTRAVGLEKNCAQVLILGAEGDPWPRSGGDACDEIGIGVMKHRPAVASGSFRGLSADAFAALAYIHATAVRQRSFLDGHVTFLRADLLAATGQDPAHADPLPILDELLEGSFHGLLAVASGERLWGELRGIEGYDIGRNGVCRATIPEFVCANLAEEFVAFLDLFALLALKLQDPIALRLWLYAEAQNLKRSRFARSGLPRCVFREPYTDKNEALPLSTILSLPDDQDEALARLHAAVDVVNEVDPQYALFVEIGKSPLVVFKRADVGGDS